MRILIASTENFVLGEKTFFSADIASGATTLAVENAGNFEVNQFIILGTIGTETTEIRKISEISEDLLEITISEGVDFAHYKSNPIQRTRFDKRKFYRSSEEDGDYTHLSSEGSPVDIQVDVPEGTRFEDSSGTDSYYYKATYYNSYSSEETSLDDANPSKASDAEHYTSLYRIRIEAGLLENSYITSDLINSYRIEAEAEVDGIIASVYSLSFSYIPKILQHIVTLLAAGNLLAKEYGMEADIEISKSGQRKIERANTLLEKITNGDLLLIGEGGDPISRRSSLSPSGSNEYDEDIPDKGELFNLESEHFRMTDHDEPLSVSRRRVSRLTNRPIRNFDGY